MANLSPARALWRRPVSLLLTLAWAWLSAPAARAQSTANDLTAAWLGTIDQANLQVTGLPANGRVAQLLSGARASAGASIKVVNAAGVPVAKATVLGSGLSVLVTAASGAQKSYALQAGGAALPVQTISNAPSSTQTSITNSILSISGNSEYHITGSNPLPGTMIDMQGEDVWLYFEGVKPSKFNQRLLAQVTVNGQRAQLDTTVRLVQYLQGCVLISQPGTYQPLEAFASANYGGSSMKFNQYDYYKTPELGAFNDNIGSFKLKKGYMATFAENQDGTGFSKVYIAPDNDVTINTLPLSLQGRTSLVRVLPWRWVSKKGWCSAPLLGDSLHMTWNYNWNNNGNSTLDAEYVPIRQTQYWPAFSITNAKKNVTHFLGFNEPNTASQSNMSVNQAIAAWPGLMQSGLRLGSPAPTDGGANWLYQFMDKADSAGYRVDFVAVHFYRGCQTPQQFYSFLKAIYDRTKRPIWITEWNNGANWTTSTGCPKPTYAEQAAKIQGFVTMLDTARIVERYSLYQWVEDTRKLFVNDGDPTSITPAGIVYRDKISPMAFNPNLVPPTVSVPVPIPFQRGNLVVTRYGSATWTGGTGVTLPAFIDEVVPMNSTLYTAGQFIRSVTIPTGSYGPNFGYVGSAMKANADGAIGISPDRTKMAISGFSSATGNGNVNGGTSPRVVAILDAEGNLDTRTGFSDGNSQPMRTATVTDSATVYIAYGNNSYGLRHASLPRTLTSVPQTRTGVTVFPTISLKKLGVYEGSMYFTTSTVPGASSTSGGPVAPTTTKVMRLSGLPGRASTPATLPGLPAPSSTSQPGGFVMFDVNPSVPGFDLLYYTDDTPTPTLNKYTFNGTTWTARGTYAITGLNDNLLRDMTGTLVRGVPTLYGVSYTSIVRLEDRSTTYTLANTAFTNTLNVTQTVLRNNATSTTYAYRGIAFTPGTRDSLYVRVPQTITFGAISDKAMGAPDFYPTATSTSGLQLGYATSDLNVATVNNGLVSIVGPGTATITVSQLGDFKYLAAAPVSRTFTVLSDLTVVAGQQMTMAAPATYGNVLVQGELTLSAPLTAAGTITVAGGGMLSTGCQPITGAADFKVEAGAELRVCDAAGLMPTGTMSGAVQTTGTRTFSPDATYGYMGTQAQQTGAGLPAQVRALLVQNPAGVALSAPLRVAQLVRLTQGDLNLGSQPLTLLSEASGTALVDNTGGVVNGTVTMQRYLDPSLNPGPGYRHYSAPVSSTTVADLSTSTFAPAVAGSTFPTVYGYDQSRLTAAANFFDQGWVAPASLSTPLAVGQGYTVNIGGTELVDFVGTLNNGPLNLNLSRGVPSEAGWQLLGNPYPAPLDWSTVTVPAGLGNAMYVYQSTGQYAGSYRSFANGIGQSPLIPAGQGFFVRVSTAGATPTLALTNANRVTTFGAQPAMQRTAETRPLVQLQLSGTNGVSDDAYVYFEAGATAAADARYDAHKLRNVGPKALNVFSLAAGTELSINGLPQPGAQSLVVPLGVAMPQAGTYTLRAAQLLNQTGSVSLRDALTGTVTPLTAQATYRFSVAAGASATGRFELLFGPQQVLSTASALSQQVTLFPNPAHGEVQLTLTSALQSEVLQAEVLNALGQTVLTRTLPAGALRTLPLGGLATGVYTVRMLSRQGVISKRLVVQ
ncbi:glycosyl hydrolase [Hymenobacter sp. M29]|uniref:Glycosyl hydrolase n=1 Tax=Hymenobacter mellowenesis TaxID=3063995 RepID=A0ABT9A9U6_9BACT|nr:glycosyl hydrolase [Hymenobacter sp. M29]MDO7845512.1 glycosyl hydrolase [Hymenobacter sp. M29]